MRIYRWLHWIKRGKETLMNNKEVDLEVADMMGDIETVADGNALGCYFCASTASSATGCAATASTASTLGD
jgi:hypothetical protein